MIHDIRVQECEFLKRPYLPQSAVQSFHLFYVFDGDGFLIIDSSSYPCHQNELLLFANLKIAIAQSGTHSALTVFHIAFTANSPNLLSELQSLPNQLHSDTRFRNLITEILHEYTLKQPAYLDVCSFYLEQLLFPSIISVKRQKKLHFPLPLTESSDGILTLACNYIEQHLTEDLSVPILCQITHLSEKRLNQLFRSFYQQSAVEYICTCRLSKAKSLLHFSNYSITQIAEYAGFKSVHYFSALFKKKEGITPSEYKKRLSDSLD